jgi:hypothetical protein
MSFDLSQQNYSTAAEAGYTLNLVLPDGTESDATITILGDLSPTVKNFGKRKYKEIKAQIDAAKRRGKEWEPSLEDAEDSAVEAAMIRLVGWNGITEGGKKVEFSKEKAQEVLKAHPWIRELIVNESANVANFTPPKTSKV